MKVMLAKNYSDKIDPAGWYMSEKMDGVRAMWDGYRFISRNGNVFTHPPGFMSSLKGSIMLDGELWGGRGTFNATSGQVRRKSNQDWSNITYCIFELPTLPGNFIEHVRSMRDLVLGASSARTVHQELCKGAEHLRLFEEMLLEKGAEGVMLRKAHSYYENRRSPNLLKIKRFERDVATVIDYDSGKGRNEGRVGALVCSYRDTTICLGTGLSDEDRNDPPARGTRVIFKYFEMSKDNIPRFPVFVKEM